MNMDDKPLGIVGAGTMGSGIALSALYAGLDVILQDPFPGSLEKGKAYLESFLAKKGLEERISKVSFQAELEGLAPASVVIEAAPETLELKQQIFSKLDAICPKDTILATNTSTLSVTEIAAVTRHPGRVAGMHFFNPPAVLKLVEVVRGMETSRAAIDALFKLAQLLGKVPVETGDTPGFIVNRVARPFYGEALRLLGEKAADHQAIDRVLEAGAGFRMGPFRLMDLIGIDINATAMRSMYEQTFGEPRYRPHWIQMQMMQAGRLGRKSGRGFYDYGETLEESSELHLSEAPLSGPVLISKGTYAPGLAARLAEAGFPAADVAEDPPPVAGFVVTGREEDLAGEIRRVEASLPYTAPLFVQAADISLSSIMTHVSSPERLVAFDGLFLGDGGVVTLVASPLLKTDVKETAARIFASLDYEPLWAEDTPGLIAPRVVCMLVNEAAFAVLEGVADAETIDRAMQLGVNYPRDPLAWGRQIGYGRVLSVLDHLRSEYGEERYRACLLIRRWARQ